MVGLHPFDTFVEPPMRLTFLAAKRVPQFAHVCCISVKQKGSHSQAADILHHSFLLCSRSQLSACRRKMFYSHHQAILAKDCMISQGVGGLGHKQRSVLDRQNLTCSFLRNRENSLTSSWAAKSLLLMSWCYYDQSSLIPTPLPDFIWTQLRDKISMGVGWG